MKKLTIVVCCLFNLDALAQDQNIGKENKISLINCGTQTSVTNSTNGNPPQKPIFRERVFLHKDGGRFTRVVSTKEMSRGGEGEPTAKKNFSTAIFPNPATGEFTVHHKNRTEFVEDSKVVIEMFNLTGQLVTRQNLTSEFTTFQRQDSPSGLYLWRIINITGEIVSSGKLAFQ